MIDVTQPGDRVLDLAGDLGLHLSRRSAGLRDGYRHGRNVEIRRIVDPQLDEAHPAGDRQKQEQDDGGDRVADRPRGNIAVHGLASFS